MELRHLRYFIAVAEEGSLSHAAEKRLHTAQPSLSRQIRDLEMEVGVKLLERRPRGVTLTAAGRIFLDHARMVLAQVETAGEAARRAEQPDKPVFILGFLVGQEVAWLPETLRIFREEAPGVEINFSSLASPELALALMRGKMDVAFMRRETQSPGLAYKLLFKEPLIVILPKGHRLTANKAIQPVELAREVFIKPAHAAPVLRSVIDDYLQKAGITLKAAYEGDNLSAIMSLVASTGGLALCPVYAQNSLIAKVVSRPLQGVAPTIELVLGYAKSNTSPWLKRFLSRTDDLVRSVQKQISHIGTNQVR
ncbi:MAG TPA: LysR family transcriptional regulator [Verrucomicrobiae bacterium]|jgi:LysR family hca operon transcriptional activator|nr:LysR family transcriptional regulator [Verrucomicrobiae bacterium]